MSKHPSSNVKYVKSAPGASALTGQGVYHGARAVSEPHLTLSEHSRKEGDPLMKLTLIDKQLSEGFTAFLGGETHRGPFSLTEWEQYDILYALVEVRQLEEEKENPRLGIYPAANITGGGAIGHVFGSPLNLTARASGMRQRDLVRQRAKEYGYDTIFGGFDHKKSPPLRTLTIFPKDYPLDEQYFPDKMQVDSQHYDRTHRILLTVPNGRVAGCLAGYTNTGGRTILIPGEVLAPNTPGTLNSIYKYTLVPGGLPLPYLLWNEHKLERFQRSTVFLCEDVLTAVGLDNIIEDTKRFEPGTFVAAALATSSELAVYADYRGLWRKHVVFIPSPNRRSSCRAHEMAKACREAGCASFSVLRAPILLRPGSQIESAGVADPWERYMVDNAIILSNEESAVLTRMKDLAVDLDKYLQWAVSVDLLRKHVEETQPSLCRSEGFVSPTLEEIERSTSREVRTDAVASWQEVGVIIAETNVGKTQFAVAFSVARAAGKSVLRFEAVAPEVVLYCDGESTGGRLKASIHRSATACGADMALLNKNLRQRYLRNEHHKQSLDLSESYLQGILEAEIQKHKVKLLVLDNLIALLPGFRRRGGKKWENAWIWIRKMEEKYGVAILIVHHSNTEGFGAGTLDIETQCQNIIYLEDPRNQKKGSSDAAFGPFLAADRSGVLLRVVFSKCKRYPHLEGKPFGASLAYNPNEPTEGPPWEFIDLEAEYRPDTLAEESESPASADETQQAVSDPVILWPDRTEEERRILQHAAGEDRFTRKDVESLLRCKASKAGDRLKGLTHAGLLKIHGSGKDANYEYVQS